MRWNSRKRALRAFTLVELLVVLAIITILLSLGGPLLSGSLAQQRQRVAIQALHSGFSLARREAIVRATAVTVCPLSGVVGECGADSARGWQVFADSDRDQRLAPGREQLLRLFPALASGIKVTNRLGTRIAGEAVTWFPDGGARRTLTLQLCDSRTPARNAFSLVLNNTGRARLARGEGQCPGGPA